MYMILSTILSSMSGSFLIVNKDQIIQHNSNSKDVMSSLCCCKFSITWNSYANYSFGFRSSLHVLVKKCLYLILFVQSLKYDSWMQWLFQKEIRWRCCHIDKRSSRCSPEIMFYHYNCWMFYFNTKFYPFIYFFMVKLTDYSAYCGWFIHFLYVQGRNELENWVEGWIAHKTERNNSTNLRGNHTMTSPNPEKCHFLFRKFNRKKTNDKEAPANPCITLLRAWTHNGRNSYIW